MSISDNRPVIPGSLHSQCKIKLFIGMLALLFRRSNCLLISLCKWLLQEQSTGRRRIFVQIWLKNMRPWNEQIIYFKMILKRVNTKNQPNISIGRIKYRTNNIFHNFFSINFSHQFLFKEYNKKKKKEINQMSLHTNSINITQAGRKFMQLHNIMIQNQTRQKQVSQEIYKKTSSFQLPPVNSCKQPHECQLRQLPFKLNRLYKNNLAKYAEHELKTSHNSLKNELLRDLGYNNKFTSRKAEQLAYKILQKKEKQNSSNCEKQSSSLLMQLSKRRNYLTRINYLHSQQENKYDNIRKVLEMARNKQNLDTQ